MEKRIELLQEGFAARTDRQAKKRRREAEDAVGSGSGGVEGAGAAASSKMSASMKLRLEEQQHRVDALQTENSKLQFDLSSAKSETIQTLARLDEGARRREKELTDEVNRFQAQLKEVGSSTFIVPLIPWNDVGIARLFTIQSIVRF